VVKALKRKIPKLAAASADKRILLLEMNAVAGCVADQFPSAPDEPTVHALLLSIDEIWEVNTAALESEDTISTGELHPRLTARRTFARWS
jgi:hypothetical protein